MEYKRLCRGLADSGKLVPVNASIQEHINSEEDWYLSTYNYTEKHKDLFEQSGSISGIVDVTTDKIWWDFDSKDDVELARQNAISLCQRLLEKKVPEKDIVIAFSGNKGFFIGLTLIGTFTPEQIQNAAFKLANDLPTFDQVVYNPSRIFRIVGTKHKATGLYKTLLSFSELTTLSTTKITYKANKKTINTNNYDAVVLPVELFAKETKLTQSVVIKNEFDFSDIDFARKVRGWPNCKWALRQGYQIKSGDRNDKLLCLIAQARALNEDRLGAYNLAKTADTLGSQIYGCERATKSEIYQKVDRVYSDAWKGGAYTCKGDKHLWLSELCQSLGPNKCKHTEVKNLIDVRNVFEDFSIYAKDIDKNTIKTGIVDLDKNLRIVVGQMVGILGAPSSGKSALALEILENTSKEGLLSVFYSLDMASSEMYQKIVQRVTGYTDQKLFDIFKNDPKGREEIGKMVDAAYSNVKFCFDTGVSVENIEKTIEDFEESSGRKVKLLLLDYNELLSSPHSDMTASSGYNAGAIKKLTNGRGLCTISLLQPPKMVGDAGDEINSYRNIKGSSLLEQCFSIIIGIYRPGFTAENNSMDDNYMIMNVVKNRLGKLFQLPFAWNGLRGKITSLADGDYDKLKELKDRKKEQALKKQTQF